MVTCKKVKASETAKVILLILLAFESYNTCPNDELCRECIFQNQDHFQCISCQNSYLDIKSNTCVPVTSKIENCLSYDPLPPHRCIECMLGFYVDHSGNCVKCGESCLICLKDECIGCADRWVPKDNDCDKCELKCSDPNCQICNKADRCMFCDNGYSFDQTGVCTRSFDYCWQIEKDGNCVKCWSGFFLDNNFRCVSIERHPAAWYFFAIFMLALVILGVTIFMKKDLPVKRKYTDESLLNLGQ